jgi:acyl carrier protein
VTDQELETAVKRILIEDLQLAPESIEGLEPSTPLLGRGLGLDSMEALTLATSLEHHLQIQIFDAELTPDLFSSFSSLVQLVRSKLNPDDENVPRTEPIR